MSSLSRPISLATILAFLLAAPPALARSKGTVVSVVDATGEAIPNVVLWVTPESPQASQAFITNLHGAAHLPNFNCKVCLITALDPKGLFDRKTSEFSGNTSSLTLTLQVKPIIDSVDLSPAKATQIKIEGSKGLPLHNQTIVIRQQTPTLQGRWAWWLSTNASGIAQARISPGNYVLATVIRGKPQESMLKIEAPGAKGNRDLKKHKTKLIVVHLSRPLISNPPQKRREMKSTGKMNIRK